MVRITIGNTEKEYYSCGMECCGYLTVGGEYEDVELTDEQFAKFESQINKLAYDERLYQDELDFPITIDGVSEWQLVRGITLY